jgi:hypothetical protein
MPFPKLQRFEKAMAAAKAEEAEKEARDHLKRTVRDVLPKRLKVPERKKGRTAIGGLSRREVAELRAKAARFLSAAGGGRELEEHVQHTVLTILLIDGVLGTEPWRASGGPHSGLIAANARVRFLDNAVRILDDLRRSRGGDDPNKKLLEGVIDAEVVPAPEPKSE